MDTYTCPDHATRMAAETARPCIGGALPSARRKRLLLYGIFVLGTVAHALSLQGRPMHEVDWIQGIGELLLLTVVLADVLTLVEPAPPDDRRADRTV